MRTAVCFFALMSVKLVAGVFYSCDIRWAGEATSAALKTARLGMLLNHTTLFDLLIFGGLPISVLWRIAGHGVVPGADITMNRPIAGRFIRLLASNVVSITRRRDETWTHFLSSVAEDSFIMIAPEGRMKRANGLDKDGQPMTVRGGISDLLRDLTEGKMVIGVSAGLHHIQSPGQGFPRLFKRIQVFAEVVEIADYKRQLGGTGDPKAFTTAVIKDLENRRDRYLACAGD